MSKVGLPCRGVDLKLQLSEAVSGAVCATHSEDVNHWTDQPFKAFVVGQVQKALHELLSVLFPRAQALAVHSYPLLLAHTPARSVHH